MKPLRIDPEQDRPIYKQIQDYYREAILNARMKAGEQLPSARSLAASLGVNMLTCNKAFQNLKAEKLIEARRGEGMFVLGDALHPERNQHYQQIRQKARQLIQAARSFGLEDTETRHIIEMQFQYLEDENA